ncbi:MAG TPA: cation:dicarboxylase symporter family transporter [Bryobacteraceae bacterium]|jgi:proton glutamate symport protein
MGDLKRISLTSWIVIGLVAGILVGQYLPETGKNMGVLSNIFLRLIKSIIAPLIFGTLVHGIAGAGDIKAMGRIGAKAIAYFEILTTMALAVGLLFVNVVKPGVGVVLTAVATSDIPKTTPQNWSQILEHTFPTSVVQAMAEGEVLQLVVFSFLFGMACSAIGKKAHTVVEFCESLSEVMFRYTKYVMYLAPLGVFGAIASTVGKWGLASLQPMLKLVGTLYASQVFFVLCVMVPVMVLTRVPVKRFFQYVKDPFIIAFTTASSESALPRALENMQKFGVPKHIVSFVLPTGYSFNLDGTTLYLSLAAVFCAQVVGHPLPIGTQIVMLLTLMLTSKGVAGVPRASLVVLSAAIATFGIPAVGIGLILGVDAFMDMARTSVNVLGNCLASAVVARWEGVHYKSDLEDVEMIEPTTVEAAA